MIMSIYEKIKNLSNVLYSVVSKSFKCLAIQQNFDQSESCKIKLYWSDLNKVSFESSCLDEFRSGLKFEMIP